MLLPCPACGFENIEGADICESCEAPLAELSERAPRSTVEAGLVNDTVDALETRPHASVSPESTVGEVLNLMVDTSIGCVTIIDQQGRLAGIFSERDALMRLNTEAAERYDHPIMRYMTPNPATIHAGAKLATALQMMDIGGYRHLPVLDEEGRPVKLISIRDVLLYLTEWIGA